MNEIKERVDKRPFLFERTTQVNARKAAERKYHDTLRRAGIDEEFIADKGSHARGYRYEDDDDDDDDASDLGSYRATVKQGYEDDGLSDGDRTPEEQSDLE
ncbi:protein FAM161A-like [Lingula anatina]|uniref:Protein FAM161A-like n=1 Tax=Lingula anatina TaxID=7574 RepID=A0A1S3JXX6_LINAN|nr:protein FAM161A-like [Lingula anatina]|eukprot:XP_013415265.1 protein FAM161A-like [Lingula anatina]